MLMRVANADVEPIALLLLHLGESDRKYMKLTNKSRNIAEYVDCGQVEENWYLFEMSIIDKRQKTKTKNQTITRRKQEKDI